VEPSHDQRDGQNGARPRLIPLPKGRPPSRTPAFFVFHRQSRVPAAPHPRHRNRGRSALALARLRVCTFRLRHPIPMQPNQNPEQIARDAAAAA